MEHLRPLGQADVQPGRRGAEGGDAGDDGGLVAVGQGQLVDVHVGGVHSGVSQGDKAHGLALIQIALHQIRRRPVVLAQLLQVVGHGHDHRKGLLVLNGGVGLPDDLIHGAAALVRVGHCHHVALFQAPDGLDRHKLRVSRARSDAVKFSSHVFFRLSSVCV